MAIISLTTDLGRNSPYIGVAKARLLSAMPEASIIDHAHEVESGDLIEASFLVKLLSGHCSPGSIHIIAVDNENRLKHPEILLGEGFGQFFITYNHGLLSLILPPEQGFRVLGSYTGDHGNLIPSLSEILPQLKDESFVDSYPLIASKDLIVRHALQPVINPDSLVGHVVHVDQQGTLYTNIHKTDLLRFAEEDRIVVKLSRHEQVDRMVQHRGFVEPGETACYFSELGMLVISIPRGDASRLLGIRKHGPVMIEKK